MTAAIVSSTVVAGLYGKLPARGDFVRVGLPRGFTDPWDTWLQSVIAGSRSVMGDAWLPAYLEAPIWRFALSAGLCGERAVLGLLLPSVDQVGRYFPLTLAALHDGGVDCASSDSASSWLENCVMAGLAAIESDASPERVNTMLGQPPALLPSIASTGSLWWTDGAPRVPETRLRRSGMPDGEDFAAMLGHAQSQGPLDDVATDRREPLS